MNNYKQNAVLTFLAIALSGLLTITAFAAPPANDNFANAEVIGAGSSSTASFMSFNTDATSEPGEPNLNNIGAGKSVWYKWTAPADPRPMQVSLHYSNFNTVLSIFRGSALNNLTFIDRDYRWYGIGDGNYLVFVPESGVTYYFCVDGRSGGPQATGMIAFDLNSSMTRRSMDYDEDGKTDIAVFRPADGNWYIRGSKSGELIVKRWGAAGDIPVAADFDNLFRRSDFPVFRPSDGTWYISYNAGLAPSYIQFGQAGDIPVTGNFLGNLTTDIGVFRPSNGAWYLQTTSGDETRILSFGLPGDIPVHGDFDTDARTDIAVFRPSDGNWYINSSKNGQQVFHWGQAGDIPLRGDFDGDDISDFAVYRPSEGNWYIHRSANGTNYVKKWGLNGDVPINGDFDGDGRFDFALFRPSNSTWYISSSALGTNTILKWGMDGDIPLARN